MNVDGYVDRGRPKKRWVNSVKDDVNKKRV